MSAEEEAPVVVAQDADVDENVESLSSVKTGTAYASVGRPIALRTRLQARLAKEAAKGKKLVDRAVDSALKQQVAANQLSMAIVLQEVRKLNHSDQAVLSAPLNSIPPPQSALPSPLSQTGSKDSMQAAKITELEELVAKLRKEASRESEDRRSESQLLFEDPIPQSLSESFRTAQEASLQVPSPSVLIMKDSQRKPRSRSSSEESYL